MTYSEILEIVKQGKTARLPHFEGYFKWDFGHKYMYFINGDFRCKAEDLPIKNRKDWFYII